MKKILRKALYKISSNLRYIVIQIFPFSWIEFFRTKKASFQEKRNIDKQWWGLNYPPQELEVKMWGGFSKDAVSDLELLKLSTNASINRRIDAAVYLSRWFYFNGDYHEALENINYCKQLGKLESKLLIRFESEILLKLNRHKEATEILSSFIQKYGADNDIFLTLANTYFTNEKNDEDSIRIELVNNIFKNRDLLGIKKIYENSPLSFENFTAQEKETIPPIFSDLKVSIIMPAFNAQDTISIAIKSLLSQTWRNVEIIVVDDCSTDDTFQVVMDFAEKDNRIIPVQHKKNLGAYGARNTGLMRATGEFVTVNDSDDWAHPQKIEKQMDHLLSNVNIVGSITKLVRVGWNLTFNGAWRLSKELIRENPSSLLVHNEIINQLGGWDQVRSGGDSELIARLRRIYGKNSVQILAPETPYSFCLDLETNLTKKDETHLKTLYFGKRNDYTEVSTWWRLNTSIPYLKFDRQKGYRPFKIPESVKTNPTLDRVYDLIIISDFCERNDSFSFVYQFMLNALELNKRIGIFHYPSYKKLKKYRPFLNKEIYELINIRNVDRISVGEDINAKVIVFVDPRLLHHKIDGIPKINFEKLLLFFADHYNEYDKFDRRPYKLEKVTTNILELFGTSGLWIATNEIVKEYLSDQYIDNLNPDIWPPFICLDNKMELIMNKPIPLKNRITPKIGSFSFRSPHEWLTIQQGLYSAYCANEESEIYFYGSLPPINPIISKFPKNWFNVIPSHEEYSNFLNSLDFFLYFPNKLTAIPQFDKALHAISQNCIVVTSYEKNVYFGEAAIYCETRDVWQTIISLWQDKEAYFEQLARGKNFLIENNSPEAFLSKLNKLI